MDAVEQSVTVLQREKGPYRRLSAIGTAPRLHRRCLDETLRPEQCSDCGCDGQQEGQPGEEGGDLLGLDLVGEVMADLVVRRT